MPLLFSLHSNPKMAKSLADLTGLSLSPLELRHFADGEAFAKPLCPVKGETVYVLAATSHPVNDRLMELLVFVDALKRGKAKKIIGLFPYLGYARQDNPYPDEPFSAALIGKLLGQAGIDEGYVIDFHSPHLLGDFPFPMHNIPALPHLLERYPEKIDASFILVSPDRGGVARVQEAGKLFPEAGFAFALKYRPSPNAAAVEGINGEVKGKHCIILDDMVDTAGTLAEVASSLRKEGALSVGVVATHGIFSPGAEERILEARFEHLLIGNTIEREYPLSCSEIEDLAGLFRAAF